MAKINALPSLEVINTLKGTLDFYYWKGIPCVRKWPHIPHSSRTQPSLDSAHLFGLIVQGWALVGGAAKTLYIEAAKDQPKTARDLYVSGVLGGQHEASMSDFLDLLTEIKDYLADLQALLGPLGSVNTDDLQIDIKGALTTLPVRGEDQLFSFANVLGKHRTGAISGAGGYFDSTFVPAGQIWHITNIRTSNVTSATTAHLYAIVHDGTETMYGDMVAARAAAVASSWQGHLWLDPSDVVRVYFTGALGGDLIHIRVIGHTITLET